MFIPQMQGDAWKVGMPLCTSNPLYVYLTGTLTSHLFYPTHNNELVITVYIISATQHEEASVMMLKHLISDNELEEEFKFYGLDHRFTFIKNLILGWNVSRGEDCSGI